MSQVSRALRPLLTNAGTAVNDDRICENAPHPSDLGPVDRLDQDRQVPRRGAVVSSPAETRLKLIIESAPASLIVASPDGTVLAANREALTLLGINRLENLLGTGLDAWVAGEDRERFRRFISQVCEGEPATLEYELGGPDGATRFVEARAVPLWRDGVTPAAFLSVAWDVSERTRAATASQRQAQARCELLDAQLLAQRDAYEAALRDAKAAYEEMVHDRANERKALGQAIRDGRARVQARLAEAEERHERLAAEWDAEREALKATLRAAEERQASLSAQAIAEHNARQLATLEALEAQHQTSLSAQAAENKRLEAALNDMRARLLQLDEERSTERQYLEHTLGEERARCLALVEEREQWRAKLTELLRALTQEHGGAAPLPGPAAASPGVDTPGRAPSPLTRNRLDNLKWGF